MPDLKTTASVSIVVPFHNEEPYVIEMYWRLHAVMEALGRNHQFVFVDGSTDLTGGADRLDLCITKQSRLCGSAQTALPNPP